MKDKSFELLLCFALGGYAGRYMRGAWYWGWESWLVIVTVGLFVLVVSHYDTWED